MSDPQSDPQDWTASVSDQARDWVLRLSSGEMDAAEIGRFKAWVSADDAHARAFEQRRSLWLQLGEHPELFATPKLPAAGPPRHARPRMAGGYRRAAAATMAVAASLLAVMAAPEAILRLEADHRTGADVAEYRLPDGSAAWLDAGSAIRVDFGAQERKVTLLRGNAFFTVRHGEERPFRVAARQGIVEDIGTSFEVRRGDMRVDVAVTEGAVRVEPGGSGQRTVVLREGQSAAYDASGVLVRNPPSDPNGMAAWRRKELMLDRQALPAVVREVARYRNGPTWVWADLEGRAPVSGALRIGDADAALRDLAAEQGLKIVWLPGGVAIVRHGDAGAP